MKKRKLSFLSLIVLSLLSVSFVSACGCGHDSISVVDKAGVVTRGANIRNVACMLGSEKIATLSAGTKVRIVGQTAWTQIVLPDGRVGWIGNDFVKETSDRNGVPAHVNNAAIGNYCNTTNPNKCMNPAALHVIPTFSYKNNPTPAPTPTPTVTPTPTQYTPPALTDSEKNTWKKMIDGFVQRVENKYSNGDDQIKELERVRNGLNLLKDKTVRYKPLITYLVELLDDSIALKNIGNILNF